MTVRVVPRVGSRLPAYCTAAGKVQIAYMSDEELDHYMPQRELDKFTANTITDREALKKQCVKIHPAPSQCRLAREQLGGIRKLHDLLVLKHVRAHE